LEIDNSKAKLLLHACCAPCLTAVEEKLRDNFDLKIYWYNPNIEPKAEHDKRLETLKYFLSQLHSEKESNFRDRDKITPFYSEDNYLAFFEYDYEKENAKWRKFISGLKNDTEGGKRCQKCIEFRLQETLLRSSMKKYDFFTTTLSVSPHKDSAAINQIGSTISPEKYLKADFKKNNGYQRSIELSKKYNLYRQSYCGCSFSK